MEATGAAGEVRHLQACINDLISVLALPAMWAGAESHQVARTLVEVLRGMLGLELVYVRLPGLAGAPALEVAHVDPAGPLPAGGAAVGGWIAGRLGVDVQQWVRPVRCPLADGGLTLVPLRLGLQGEMGMVVAGSTRADFPARTDQLLLSVAANQAAIGLQEARRLGDQQQLARELDLRVAERTAALAAAIEALKREVADRRLAEARVRQEERRLSQSEARKAAILDSALDCIITIDHQGGITEFNPAAERTFGFPRDAVLGRHLADLILPAPGRMAFRVELAQHLITGEPGALGRRVELAAMRADGSEFPAELTITRIPVAGPPAFTFYLRDITERRRSEDAVRESELNLRQMTETIPEMLWSATPEGAVDYCNTRLLEYTGCTAGEIMGSGWAGMLHPDDVEPTRREWMSCVATGAPYRVEVRAFHAADRTYRWCMTNARALLDADGRILRWHGTVVDMHDWREAQETLRRTQAELAHMTRVTTMGQLTASIAHEVNQPLAGIITNASTCLRMLATDPPNLEGARETARRTIRDGHRASEVVSRLRALFHKRAVVAEPVDLNEAAREVLALSVDELEKSGVILRPEFSPDLPIVAGDRIQLQQVILNLLLNAADAMRGVEDRPRLLEIRTEAEEADWVRLTVRDAGTGLDPEARDRLFEAFYTTKEQGMGIGLSVSRSIIEGHGGRLWAASNDGPGATFAFSIPRAVLARRPGGDGGAAGITTTRHLPETP